MLKEKRLIMLSVIKLRSESEEIELNELFQECLDWAWITGQLYRHRLEGYFISYISEIQRSILIFKVRQSLELMLKVNEIINKEQLQITEILFHEIQNQGINVAGLKGVVFNTSIYSLSVRRSNDIDLLVNEKDMQIMDDIMEKHNFIQSIDYGETKATRKDKLVQIMNYHDLVPYYKKIDNQLIDKIKIDINIHFDEKENDITDDILSHNIMKYEKNGYCVNGLTWRLHLCHLMVRFFREVSGDIWIREFRDIELYKLVDIENTVRTLKERDLVEWVESIKKYHLSKHVFVTLYYLNKLYPKKIYVLMMDKLQKEVEIVHTEGKIIVEGHELLEKNKFFNKAFNMIYRAE